MALHDGGVEYLATRLAERGGWTVHAGVPGFPTPAVRGAAPDIVCDRGREAPPIVVEVELPETLVRKDTVRRLRSYVDAAYDTHLVLVADPDDHDEAIEGTRRMLECVGLESIPIGALAPDRQHMTGVTW